MPPRVFPLGGIAFVYIVYKSRQHSQVGLAKEGQNGLRQHLGNKPQQPEGSQQRS